MLLPGNKSSSWAELPESNRSEAPGGGGGPGLEAVIVPVVFGLIFVVGVVGNSLVILVIGKVKYGGVGGGSGRRSGNPTNIFILNLSVADLSFLLFCVPFQATIYSLPQWVFGAFLCRFGHYFSTVSMLVSIFTLAAMSVDRYIAVVRSKKSPCVRSRRNALAGVCVIWTLSVVCSVPVAQHQFLTSHPNAPNSTFCWEEWSGASRLSYKVSVLLLGYLLPLLLICCCYTRVLFHLHKKMKNMSKKSERSKRKHSASCSGNRRFRRSSSSSLPSLSAGCPTTS
ncbi:galanin receptor type 1b isoform X3 [Cottoperca gobio]|uniref:Galanin receptor type 1b isoform X3 n=1 Tax=Cottoperca gobio TaxID=56716 RepID=A0A6J2PDM8_COTGO|nr:galanin receptor type 1-like isoform X3 [Cottoperca gobio]